MTDRLEEEIDELQETCEKLKKIQSQSHNRSIPKIDVWTMWPGVPSGSLQQWNSVKKLKGKGHAEEKSTAIEFALNLQCKFEGEDRQLEQEHRALAATAQALFDCAICLDTFPMDYAARVVECNHLACRNCLRQHLLTTLHDHRFPIFCSICTDGDKKSIHSSSTLGYQRRSTVSSRSCRCLRSLSCFTVANVRKALLSIARNTKRPVSLPVQCLDVTISGGSLVNRL